MSAYVRYNRHGRRIIRGRNQFYSDVTLCTLVVTNISEGTAAYIFKVKR
jgi:hypothetical protein